MNKPLVTAQHLADAQWNLEELQSLLHAMEAASKTPVFDCIAPGLFHLADELMDEIIFLISTDNASTDKKEKTA